MSKERPEYQVYEVKRSPLPNPFLAGWMVDDLRRQRIAENEMGKEEHEAEQEIPNK